MNLADSLINISILIPSLNIKNTNKLRLDSSSSRLTYEELIK